MLLLHGLAGHAGEWERSAQLLIGDHRVFALDQRGHGDSERRPDDVSREAYVEDCAVAIQQLGLGPVTLVGQSMGANTAMLTAADHPDLVRMLVVIEGSPDGPEPPDPEPEIAAQIRDSLAQWPVPFADDAAAHSFFSQQRP
jgi:pimeloyl-ACP methyl ester carboxylesterase